jgi:rhodanese-related sulfurtransferase
MFRMLFVVGVLIVLVPRAEVQAILPPDLIISTAQSLMSVFGLIIASVVLVIASVKNYLFILLPTRRRQLLFLLVIIIGISLLAWSLFVAEEQRQLDQWQEGVDAEIRGVWDQYKAAYSASDEKQARQSLTSSAQEITWNEFSEKVAGEEYLIVDIRDLYAYQVGYFEGSVHMRLADLLLGRWKELESYKNKPVLLICFLGTTGAIAGDFLSAQGFTDLYIPRGGLHETLRRESTPFIGDTRFKHFDEMIDRLSTKEAYLLVESGAKIIDLRSPDKYDEPTAIYPDISFFREFNSLPKIESFISSLDADTTYISLCNSDASCYQGEMFLHDLKAAGLHAGGTYDSSKPEGLKW